MQEVKTLPGEFLGHAVVRRAHLKSREGEKEFQAVITTVHTDEYTEESVYNVHTIAAHEIDEPWYGINGWYDVSRAEADELFRREAKGRI